MSFAERVVFDTSTLALTCSADFMISSDEDLLTLNPSRRIPVILPRRYLER